MRELTPESITDAVLEQMATTSDPRLKGVMAAAVLSHSGRAEHPFRSAPVARRRGGQELRARRFRSIRRS